MYSQLVIKKTLDQDPSYHPIGDYFAIITVATLSLLLQEANRLPLLEEMTRLLTHTTMNTRAVFTCC